MSGSSMQLPPPDPETTKRMEQIMQWATTKKAKALEENDRKITMSISKAFAEGKSYDKDQINAIYDKLNIAPSYKPQSNFLVRLGKAIGNAMGLRVASDDVRVEACRAQVCHSFIEQMGKKNPPAVLSDTQKHYLHEAVRALITSDSVLGTNKVRDAVESTVDAMKAPNSDFAKNLEHLLGRIESHIQKFPSDNDATDRAYHLVDSTIFNKSIFLSKMILHDLETFKPICDVLLHNEPKPPVVDAKTRDDWGLYPPRPRA